MGKLEHVDRRDVLSELIGLQMTLGPIAENPPEFTLDGIRLHVKRLRAILPEDPDLVADLGSVQDVRHVAEFLIRLQMMFHLDGDSGSLPPRLYSDQHLSVILRSLIYRFTPDVDRTADFVAAAQAFQKGQPSAAEAPSDTPPVAGQDSPLCQPVEVMEDDENTDRDSSEGDTPSNQAQPERRGERWDILILSALLTFHYGKSGADGIENWEPIGYPELIKLCTCDSASPSKATVSRWFKENFTISNTTGYEAYKIACRTKVLLSKLQELTGEAVTAVGGNDIERVADWAVKHNGLLTEYHGGRRGRQRMQ